MTLANDLKQPLDPFVSLSVFLTGQHTSLSATDFPSDPTMQLLYGVAARLFHDQITPQEDAGKDLVSLCDDASASIQRALDLLGSDSSSSSQVTDSLHATIQLLGSYKAKYHQSAGPISSSPSPPSSSSSSSSAPPAKVPRINVNDNWAFVTDFIENSAPDQPIPWQRIYDDGKKKQLFSTYSNWKTMKAAYYRWMKRRA
ncbi:hypothetical protein DM01DRAFT_1338869 [Hesseltinella vesiculosa]|uniref:Uncharacterized protein n=1 Tax=Hesseltinella vesiculosa TaxID=101127 RepID=A0A1X2G906_9FUNG|nr:hypothetical protein DM01DRAFT_1338869 [Hesseltinella vesiculosa]